MRDIKADDTIYIGFTTRAFATGIPTTLAGSPVVSAYEDAGLTQITAGITLSVDHDGVTGFHMLTIVATSANGYDTGKDYNLVITTGTVGGVSVVGEVIGQFSIDRSPAAQDLANGTDGLSALKALIDTIDGIVDNILTDTNELQTDDIPTAISNLNNISTAQVNTECDTALTDYDPPTKAEMDTGHGLLATEAKQDVIDGIVDNIIIDTAVIGALGAGLTAIPWNSAWDAEVQSECADALTAYDPPTKTEMDTKIDALNNISTAQVNTECDNALSDYDPPTKAEMDTKIDALNNVSTANIQSFCDAAITANDEIKRMLGFAGQNIVYDTWTWTGDNETQRKFWIYDTAGNANTHDESTGKIGQYTQTITWSGDKPTKVTILKVS